MTDLFTRIRGAVTRRGVKSSLVGGGDASPNAHPPLEPFHGRLNFYGVSGWRPSGLTKPDWSELKHD